MADETTQSTGSQPFSTGQVALPQDGQVLSTDTPTVGSTDSPGAASPANQPAPAPQNKPPVPPSAVAPATVQSQAAQTAQAKPASTPNQPSGAPSAGQQDDFSQHPAVKQASLMSTIARTLAGNPQSVTIDPITGEEKRTPAPLTKGQIAMAIVSQALSGAAAGAGAKPGPGVLGRAAEAGFAAGTEQQQARQQKTEAISQQDYNRKLQIAHTNMLMYNNAKMLGEKDAAQIDDYIKSYSDLSDKLVRGEIPGYLAVVPTTELSKYSAVGDTAIPYERVARLGQDGKQVEDNGRPIWDMKYLIYDPKLAKSAGMMSPDALDWGKKTHEPGMDNPLINDTPASAVFMANQNARLLSAKMTADDVDNNYASVLNANPSGSYTGLKAPVFSDPNVQQYIDSTVPYSNVPNELVAGILQQESSGKLNVASSPQGAIGPMQIMPSTATHMINPATGKNYTVDDLNDPKTNIQAGKQLLSQLIQHNNGDLYKSLIQYHGGGPNSKDALGVSSQQYADDISKSIGLNDKNTLPVKNDNASYTPPNWEEEAGKNGASLNNTLNAFQAHLTSTPDGVASYGKAIDNMLGDKNPLTKAQGIQMLSWLGGRDKVLAYDQYQHNKAQTAAQTAAAQVAEDKSAKERQNNLDIDSAYFAKQQKYLTMPDNFSFKPEWLQMNNPEDLKKTLAAQGVNVPANFDMLYKVGHYEINPSRLPPRAMTKFSPNEMDAQTGLDFISQFINPSFDEKNWNAGNKLVTEVADPNSNVGKAIYNTNTAVNHLQLLKEAASKLANTNGDNRLIVLNDLANKFGVQTGNAAPTVFQAIANKVNQEVERAAAGGSTPFVDELESGKNILAAKNPKEVTDQIVNSYIGLMAGRMAAADQNLYSTAQRHLWNLEPQTTAIFQQNGFDTPWAPQNQQSKQPQQNAPVLKPNDLTQYKQLNGSKTVGIGADGKKYSVATGQLMPGQ